MPQLDLVIFDKDGTLIDFRAMWVVWAIAIGRALEQAAGVPVLDRLGKSWGFDPRSGALDVAGRLAIGTMPELQALAAGALIVGGRSPADAATIVDAVWAPPDPVALARPLADLPALFGALGAAGVRIALATLDDRAPTEATLAALGVAGLVDTLVCADDGLAHKPAPDAVLTICKRLGVAPARAAMVGDTLADLRMGRAAGVGRVVGVTSGAGTLAELTPEADLVLESVAGLLATL